MKNVISIYRLNVGTVVILFILLIGLNYCYCQQEFEENSSNKKTISFKEVSRLALENSIDIQIAKLDTYIERTSLKKAESIFDTYFAAEAGYLNNKEKRASIIFGLQDMTNTYATGINKKIPLGTDIQIKANHTRIDSNSQFETINPAHEPEIGISFNQPIGKNFFGLADRSTIKLTKIDIENTEYASLTNIEGSLYQVQIAYWNLVLKIAEYRIKLNMLEESQRSYEIYKNKFTLGLVEKADLLAAEANVSIRESDVLIGLLEQDIAKNNLLFLLNEENISIQLVPEDTLKVNTENADLNESLKKAIANRRDYKIIKSSIIGNKIVLEVRKNALWPEIDLQASYRRNGLNTNFGESWDELFSENNPETYLGIKFNMPLENDKAISELEEAKYVKQKLLLSLKQVERQILTEVNNRVKEVNTAKNQIDLSISIAQLQESKLDEEKKELRYGRSSSDLIIRYENDLLDARLSLVRSYFYYRKSQLTLELTENTLLDKYWEEEL